MKTLTLASFFLLLFYCSDNAFAQSTVKPVEELLGAGNANWDRIMLMAERSKNKVQILPKDSARASYALMQSQLSTSTLLGSVINNSGGILVDDGWIRILGSGCGKLPRSVPEWNTGKINAMRNEDAFYLLVADDVMGGLFAIKAASKEELETTGQVFYYGPNGLTWQPTGLSYASFFDFCFSGNTKDFYADFRWKGWQEDVKGIDCNSVISCYPMLWTREGLQLKANRKLLAIQSQWNLYQGKSKAGSKQKSVAQRAPAQKPQNNNTVVSMWSQNASSR